MDIDELRQWVVDLMGNKSLEPVPLNKILECIDMDHDGELSIEELGRWSNCDRSAPYGI